MAIFQRIAQLLLSSRWERIMAIRIARSSIKNNFAWRWANFHALLAPRSQFTPAYRLGGFLMT